MHGSAPAGIIYLAHDRLADRVYVGQTVRTIADRRSGHNCASNRKTTSRFASAIREKGINAFDFFLIGEASNKDELNNLERLWILLLDATDPAIGYNQKLGTHRQRSEKMKEETKKKISATLKGKPKPEYWTGRIPLIARNIARTGIRLTAEHKAKCSAALKGGTRPARGEEYRRKMSLAKKGIPQTKEAIEKRIAPRRGKKLSLSARQNMSRAQQKLAEEKRNARKFS